MRLAQILEGRAIAGETLSPARPIDVLVVDDDPVALRAATAALESLGYRCRVAADAEEAVRAFEIEPAAIVLADWVMPGMSGLDLCVALKQREAPPYVILASGLHDRARILDAVRGGADDFLRKPLDLDELEARLLAASHLVRALGAVTALWQHLRTSDPSPS